MGKKGGGGRLDASALEAALEDAFADGETPKVAGTDVSAGDFMIAGRETAGHIDANLAAQLHGKLAQHASANEPSDEPSGLRAPQCTRMLKAEDLAALDDEEDGAPVVAAAPGRGLMEVDSKLVTELNRKLGDEVRGASQEKEPGGDDFGTNLQSALTKLEGSDKPSGQVASQDLNAALLQKMERLGAQEGDNLEPSAMTDRSFYDGEKAAAADGLKAPQCTVKLSADALAALDDDDKADDPAMALAKSHGPISDVDPSMMAELQKKLGGGSGGGGSGGDELERGFRAPQNTMKLDPSMFSDEDEEAAELKAKPKGNLENIDASFVSQLQRKLEADASTEGPSGLGDEADMATASRGCKAPASTMKLTQDMLNDLDDDKDEPEVAAADDPLSVAAAASAALMKMTEDPSSLDKHVMGTDRDEQMEETKSTGLRAPQSTTVITADMLAGLDDEDDIPMMPDPGPVPATSSSAPAPKADVTTESAQMNLGLDVEDINPAKPQKSINFCGDGGFDRAFAQSLQQKLETEGGFVEEADNRKLDNLPESFGGADDDQEEKSVFKKGLRAPQTTQMFTANQLAALDDEEDIDPMADDPMAGIRTGAGNSQPSSQGPPRCDPVPQANQAASGDPSLMTDAMMRVMPEAQSGAQAQFQTGPSQEQLATLTAAAMALDGSNPADYVAQQREPLLDQLSSQVALTVDSTSAMKVMEAARGIHDGTDMWGNSRPLTSSCKLRLAWLSKDEVRKENDQLHKEIAALRAEIDMHRKEASLRKAI